MSIILSILTAVLAATTGFILGREIGFRDSLDALEQIAELMEDDKEP